MKSLFQLVFSLSLFIAMHAPAEDIKLPVHFDTLSNGLRIISVPDTNVAVVSCRLYYFVGSMYESTGNTGLSHMYEHMMFKGTKRLGTTDYAKEVPIMASIDSLDKLRYKELSAANRDSVSQKYRKQIESQLEKQRTFIKKDEIWELYQNNGATGTVNPLGSSNVVESGDPQTGGTSGGPWVIGFDPNNNTVPSGASNNTGGINYDNGVNSFVWTNPSQPLAMNGTVFQSANFGSLWNSAIAVACK